MTRRQVSFPDSVKVAIVPDFINLIDWNPVLRGVDIIVHLAGMAHSRIADTTYSEFDQINWIATQRLAQAAKEAGIDRFIYILSLIHISNVSDGVQRSSLAIFAASIA